MLQYSNKHELFTVFYRLKKLPTSNFLVVNFIVRSILFTSFVKNTEVRGKL